MGKSRRKKKQHITDDRPTNQPSKRKRTNRGGRYRKKRRQPTIRGYAKLFFLSFVVSLIVLLCTFLVFYQVVNVDDQSMTPLIEQKSLALINKHEGKRRHELVLIRMARAKNKYITSRIIGVPGDSLAYRDGALIVNGVERVQATVSRENQLATEDFEIEGTLPDGMYYVLGDNRQYGTDSRYLGMVSEKEIVGRVTLTLIPWKVYYPI